MLGVGLLCGKLAGGGDAGAEEPPTLTGSVLSSLVAAAVPPAAVGGGVEDPSGDWPLAGVVPPAPPARAAEAEAALLWATIPV